MSSELRKILHHLGKSGFLKSGKRVKKAAPGMVSEPGTQQGTPGLSFTDGGPMSGDAPSPFEFSQDSRLQPHDTDVSLGEYGKDHPLDFQWSQNDPILIRRLMKKLPTQGPSMPTAVPSGIRPYSSKFEFQAQHPSYGLTQAQKEDALRVVHEANTVGWYTVPDWMAGRSDVLGDAKAIVADMGMLDPNEKYDPNPLGTAVLKSFRYPYDAVGKVAEDLTGVDPSDVHAVDEAAARWVSPGAWYQFGGNMAELGQNIIEANEQSPLVQLKHQMAQHPVKTLSNMAFGERKQYPIAPIGYEPSPEEIYAQIGDTIYLKNPPKGVDVYATAPDPWRYYGPKAATNAALWALPFLGRAGAAGRTAAGVERATATGKTLQAMETAQKGAKGLRAAEELSATARGVEGAGTVAKSVVPTKPPVTPVPGTTGVQTFGPRYPGDLWWETPKNQADWWLYNQPEIRAMADIPGDEFLKSRGFGFTKDGYQQYQRKVMEWNRTHPTEQLDMLPPNLELSNINTLRDQMERMNGTAGATGTATAAREIPDAYKAMPNPEGYTPSVYGGQNYGDVLWRLQQGEKPSEVLGIRYDGLGYGPGYRDFWNPAYGNQDTLGGILMHNENQFARPSGTWFFGPNAWVGSKRMAPDLRHYGGKTLLYGVPTTVTGLTGWHYGSKLVGQGGEYDSTDGGFEIPGTASGGTGVDETETATPDPLDAPIPREEKVRTFKVGPRKTSAPASTDAS